MHDMKVTMIFTSGIGEADEKTTEAFLLKKFRKLSFGDYSNMAHREVKIGTSKSELAWALAHKLDTTKNLDTLYRLNEKGNFDLPEAGASSILSSVMAKVGSLLSAVDSAVEIAFESIFEESQGTALAQPGGLGATHSEKPIPGFKGPVVVKSMNKEYKEAIQQYASSSNVAFRGEYMRPLMVAYPDSIDDIISAVKFAEQEPRRRIVTRSGGHQYCGLSSGGGDTIVLSMDNFTKLKWVPRENRLTLGVCNKLVDVSKFLKVNNLSLPHGECPLVNLGGHVQTGGVGHSLRSFGLILDHVTGFSMVFHDGETPYYQKFYRDPNSAPEGAKVHPKNDMIFAAVLGGGPGSWGVITDYEFKPIHDAEYKTSVGYSHGWLYSESVFLKAMEMCMDWTNDLVNNRLVDADYFVSAVSGDLWVDHIRPAIVLVETMCKEPGLQDQNQQAIERIVTELGQICKPISKQVDGPTPLSVMADEGVRKIGYTGLRPSGREFDLAYKKSMFCSEIGLTEAFVKEFVKLVDGVMKEKGLYVVFQGTVGGGKFKEGWEGSKGKTRQQRRDVTFIAVFDVFYRPNYEEKAKEFQRRMKGLVTEYNNGKDMRMFWATFEIEDGQELDITKPEVVDLYYDSPEVYKVHSLSSYLLTLAELAKGKKGD
jgi:FAD/FMN-containing dehydrogenase